MKKLLLIVLTTLSLYAEATFEQVQSMIGAGHYKQAVLALTVIAENHPNSSKVQYTLAQAQAGLGNLPEAKAALDKALALNPKLDFVPADQVKQLQQAIQPQVKLIKPVSTGPSTLEYLLVVLSFGIVAYLVYRKYSCKPKPAVYTASGTTRTKKSEQPVYTSRSTSTYSHRPDDTSSNVMNETSSYQPSYSKPTEAHHHYYDQSRGSDLGTTILASAATAAVVSTLMNDDSHSHRSDATDSYRPSAVSSNNSVSSSWNDSSSSSKSDSWEDSTSTRSTSSSWSDSSSSSSSSSWD